MLTITHSQAEVACSAQLSQIPISKMRARYHHGDLSGAVISAARAASRAGHPYFIYSGNSYGSFVWRVTHLERDALDSINNSGRVLYEVSPQREVTRHFLTS